MKTTERTNLNDLVRMYGLLQQRGFTYIDLLYKYFRSNPAGMEIYDVVQTFDGLEFRKGGSNYFIRAEISAGALLQKQVALLTTYFCEGTNKTAHECFSIRYHYERPLPGCSYPDLFPEKFMSDLFDAGIAAYNKAVNEGGVISGLAA